MIWYEQNYGRRLKNIADCDDSTIIDTYDNILETSKAEKNSSSNSTSSRRRKGGSGKNKTINGTSGKKWPQLDSVDHKGLKKEYVISGWIEVKWLAGL